MRQAPSMTGLRALEAVVRTGSLSAAARELCVTPAAISHRLRDLEAQSGTLLVRRKEGRFLATSVGHAVLEALGDAFLRIRAADAILSQSAGSTLRIVGSYSFAVLWLAPRLSRFQDRHPEVKLFLEPSHSPLDQPEADIIVLHAADPPQKSGWTRLFDDMRAAVGRASHPLFHKPGATLSDVLNAKLVNVSHGKGPTWGEFSWQSWAMALALPGPTPTAGPTVTAEHLAVDLVLAENAFALVSLVNASQLIAEGRLRTVVGSAVTTQCSYWARQHRNGRKADRLAKEFLAWLQDELADEQDRWADPTLFKAIGPRSTKTDKTM